MSEKNTSAITSITIILIFVMAAILHRVNAERDDKQDKPIKVTVETLFESGESIKGETLGSLFQTDDYNGHDYTATRGNKVRLDISHSLDCQHPDCKIK